jgi:imidazolonepropionase
VKLQLKSFGTRNGSTALDKKCLLIKDDLIADFGPMISVPSFTIDLTIDATGKMMLPTWCDSHTHIVYAGNRALEFVDRINGLSYEEIANRGGGILNSAKS